MNIRKTMIEAIESLTNEDIHKFIKNLEELQKLEGEHKRNICENILFDMIKQYDNTFYKEISITRNLEEEMSNYLKELK